VDGFDDLGVVDALEVNRGDAEVAVAELALDHDQRHALAGNLNGVGMSQLMRSEAPSHARRGRRSARAAAFAQCRPRVDPVTTQKCG